MFLKQTNKPKQQQKQTKPKKPIKQPKKYPSEAVSAASLLWHGFQPGHGSQ